MPPVRSRSPAFEIPQDRLRGIRISAALTGCARKSNPGGAGPPTRRRLRGRRTSHPASRGIRAVRDIGPPGLLVCRNEQADNDPTDGKAGQGRRMSRVGAGARRRRGGRAGINDAAAGRLRDADRRMRGRRARRRDVARRSRRAVVASRVSAHRNIFFPPCWTNRCDVAMLAVPAMGPAIDAGASDERNARDGGSDRERAG